MNKSTRLFYIDNLRIFLIILVVLHHLAITYGAPGGWYYNKSEAGFPEILPMSMFVATNQSFFMGMFFMLSAFFIIPSLERKGIRKFGSDRLLRLGVPLLLFYFVLIHSQFLFATGLSAVKIQLLPITSSTAWHGVLGRFGLYWRFCFSLSFFFCSVRQVPPYASIFQEP